MNIYIISAFASACSGIALMNLSINSQARHMVAALFAVALILAVMGIAESISKHYALQATPIRVDQDATVRPIRAAHTEPARSATPSPTPAYGASEESPILPTPGKPLAGMSFALTGKMPVKRAKMECLIECMGGTIHKRVFSNTSYLVVGESRRVSNKENKAAEWNISEITVEELAQMCGVTYYDIREHYYNIVPSEVTGARMMADMRRAEVRQYGKASMNQRTYLKELMQMHQDIALSHPIQVVVKVDEDMELAAVDRLRYNASVGDYHLFTTDGEAIYLDDIRDCSVNDIIKAVAA